MFLETCDIQNLSSIGAAGETQKHHAAPMELDCSRRFVYKHFIPNRAVHGIFSKNYRVIIILIKLPIEVYL
ncbi:MAG: hypothetical protein QY310_01515 [Candidatus Jettenia sp. CY-1]|nr:MAG: hypothetical protein QY310_01515 [Candidatus Jettenia sp. CY-1]